jgi:succinoglycan biosynthesis transport protein ExoP
MQRPLQYYWLVVKRWTWLVILGVVFCGGATFMISKLTPPVYQATATLIVNQKTSASAYDNFTTSVGAVPTYAILITSPQVLTPVLAEHPELTSSQLSAMVSVTPESNTQLIQVAVENTNPQLAAQLANQISLSFQAFANSQLPGSISIISAQVPTNSIRPKVSEYTGAGAAVGFFLALALIVVFEWMDDRLSNLQEVQDRLELEIWGIIPEFPKDQGSKRNKNRSGLTRGFHQLSANLDITQRITQPFKLVMITSALEGEGKTLVATKTATALAKAGNRVLLIDANALAPAVERHFQLGKYVELARYREPGTDAGKILGGNLTDIPDLCILTPQSFPADSLEFPRDASIFEYFKKAPFDYILFDTAPLLSWVDTQVLATYVEAIVLVIDASKTPRKALVHAKKLIKNLGNPLLGAVLNKSPWNEFAGARSHPAAPRGVRMPQAAASHPLSEDAVPRSNGSPAAYNQERADIRG